MDTESSSKAEVFFPIIGLLLYERSKKLGSFHNTPSGNVIFPVVCGGVNSESYTSYSDSEIDVVHAAFSVITATHDSGGRKLGTKPTSLFLLG